MKAAGSFYKDAFRAADWQLETAISTEGPSIYPMKKANITLPTSIRFSPNKNLVICPDNKIGPPPTNVSVPIDIALSRCPYSVIGNGQATFQLAGINSAFQKREGYMIIFHGGKKSSGPLARRPKIKIYAYSYGTQAGVYTEGVLSSRGEIVFDLPRLAADSAVTSLHLNIPGKEEEVLDPAASPGTVLPKGLQNNYILARCQLSSFAVEGTFLLGNRNNVSKREGSSKGESPSSFLKDSNRILV